MWQKQNEKIKKWLSWLFEWLFPLMAVYYVASKLSFVACKSRCTSERNRKKIINDNEKLKLFQHDNKQQQCKSKEVRWGRQWWWVSSISETFQYGSWGEGCRKLIINVNVHVFFCHGRILWASLFSNVPCVSKEEGKFFLMRVFYLLVNRMNISIE